MAPWINLFQFVYLAYLAVEEISFEFPEFPAAGPKLESIPAAEVPDKYTLTDHLWNYLQAYAEQLRSIKRSLECQVLSSN